MGFDFLGFHVRQHPRRADAHREQTAPGPAGSASRPSSPPARGAAAAPAGHPHPRASANRRSQAGLIDRTQPHHPGLDPRTTPPSSPDATFTRAATAWLFTLLRRWAKRRHPDQGRHLDHPEVLAPREGAWDFGTRGGPRWSNTGDPDPPAREGPWRPAASSTATGPTGARASAATPTSPTRVATLLRRQHGRCARCGLYFTSGGPARSRPHPPARPRRDRCLLQPAAPPPPLPRRQDGTGRLLCRPRYPSQGLDH